MYHFTWFQHMPWPQISLISYLQCVTYSISLVICIYQFESHSNSYFLLLQLHLFDTSIVNTIRNLLTQKDINLRHCMLLELLKDYDHSITYHSGKENMVAKALSPKEVSRGILSFLTILKQTFASYLQTIENNLILLDILNPIRILSSI